MATNEVTIFQSGNTPPGFPGGCFFFNGVATYTDLSSHAASIHGTQQLVLGDTNDKLYIGAPTASGTWKRFGFFAHTLGSYGALTWEYWNGSAWTSFTPQYDGTAGFTANGYVQVGTLSGWAATDNGATITEGYYIRISAASVTTAAYFYNLLPMVTLKPPLVLIPGDELPGLVRDINGTLYTRDIPLTHSLSLHIDARQRAVTLADLNLLRYWRDNRIALTIYDEARTASGGTQGTAVLTTDSFYYVYTGYLTKLDGKVSAALKMEPDTWGMDFELNTASAIVS